jgi:hypothetical protein
MPANLRATVVDTRRTLTWNAVANATDYFVLIGSSQGKADLVNTNTSQPTYQWNGASPGTYYARVYARTACGSSPNAELIFN